MKCGLVLAACLSVLLPVAALAQTRSNESTKIVADYAQLPAWAGIGTITTIAGGGPKNVLATKAHLHNPTDVATDSQGNVYIVTSGQNEVFRVDAVTGVLTAAAGSDSNGFSGDGGPAKQA